MSREKAALSAGVSVEIFYAHQRKNQQFQQAIQRADADCQRICLQSLHKAKHWTFEGMDSGTSLPPKSSAASTGTSST